MTCFLNIKFIFVIHMSLTTLLDMLQKINFCSWYAKKSRISLPLKLGNVLKCWNENNFRLKEFFGHCHNALISMLGFEIFITWIPSLLISFVIVVQGGAHFTWDCELCTTYSRGSIVWGSIRGQKQLTDTTISMHVNKMLG